MAQLLVRGLDENVRQWLKERAARHSRSMEAEVRDILTRARITDVDDPIGQVLAAVKDHRAEPVQVPDPAEHDYAEFT